MKLTRGIVILITLFFLFSLVLPTVAVPDVSNDKIEKDFVEATKTLIYKKDTKPLLEVKQISIKEGVCKFEEVFEVTALNEDYIPSKSKDFNLKFKNTKHEDALDKINTEEWFVWEDDEWKQLKWNWLHKAKKIKKDETKRYKVVVTKQAELGDKRILTVPMFMGVEDARLSWWNVSWEYRTNSTLSSVPSGGYTYQLNVHSGSGTNNQTDIFLNGHVATNFKDLRFTLDDNIELDYWIEDNSTNPVSVYIDIHSDGIVYMYYGNPSVSSISDSSICPGGNHNGYCCEFFDDFEDGVLDGYDIGGTSGWLIASDNVYQGSYSAGSDPGIGDNQDSWIRKNYISNGSIYISFYDSVSSEYGFDNMSFYIDDIYKYKNSGVVDWQKREFIIDNDGPHVFKWRYMKDGSITEGDDRAWIDNLLIRKYASPEPSWQSWSAEETETTYSAFSLTQYNSQRKLARTSEGYLHRVYTKFDGSNYRVYYAKSTDDGSIWTETVLTDVGVNNIHPAIASDSEDNLWVVYEREGGGIRYRKYEGINWQSEKNISEFGLYGLKPVIATDNNDNIHVAWYTDFAVYWLRYREYNGTAWEPIENVRTTNYPKYPSIAIDTNNYVHMVWQEKNSTTNTQNIKHCKKTSTWQDVYNITSGETYNQTHPCIATDLSGNAHIVWQTQDHQIESIKYKSDGSWEAIKTVHNGGAYEQGNPSVSVYSNNYVYATWYGKTATYNENYIIRESHKTTGSWSSVLDILHPSGKDVVYPNSISALYPVICGDCYLNVPLTGYSLIYDEDGTVKYYSASTWRCEDKYVLTIKARDTKTNQYISNFTVDSSSAETKTTDSGVVRYTCLDSGYYEVTISANEYHSSQQSIVLDQNKEIIVYLTPFSEADYFLPKSHEVRFMVVDGYGTAVEDVTVTTTCIETTMGDWDWLLSIFGFENTTTIQNTTMVGTTDSSGTISFVMIETIKYQITFVKGTEINKTLTIYPKDDKYVIRVGTFWDKISDWFSASKEEQLLGETVSWNITTEIINDTHARINLSYNDTLSKTTSQYFFVNDSNNTNLYNLTTSGEHVWDPGYVVENYSGQSYLVGFEITHGDIGDIKKIVVVTFKHVAEKLVDFGWDDSVYQLVSVALLIFTAALFTGVTVKHAAVMLPLEGWVFWYIGWFEISIILLSIAMSIGIGVYVIERGRETNVSS